MNQEENLKFVERISPSMVEQIIELTVRLVFVVLFNDLPDLTGCDRLCFGDAILERMKKSFGRNERIERVFRRAVFQAASCGEEHAFWVESGNWLPKKENFSYATKKKLAEVFKFIHKAKDLQ